MKRPTSDRFASTESPVQCMKEALHQLKWPEIGLFNLKPNDLAFPATWCMWLSSSR